jgi:hypothetical protein
MTDDTLADSPTPLAPDALSLLDHRARSRAVPAELATPGRYLAVESEDETLLVPLEREVTRIGRGITADIRIDDVRISRRHAIIVQRRRRVRVLDDRSTNGTYVNGKAISEAELEDGDLVLIGSVALRYVDLPGERQAVSVAPRAARDRRFERAFDGWLSSRMRIRSRARRLGRHPRPRNA